jgi:hypothetical protein
MSLKLETHRKIIEDDSMVTDCSSNLFGQEDKDDELKN